MKKVIPCFFVLLAFFCVQVFSQNILEKFRPLIKKGDFSKAQVKMKEEICKNLKLSINDKMILEFEIERLERIKLDFKKEKPDVIKYIKKYLPGVTDKNLNNWENEKSLECLVIDGKKKYFNSAPQNLFRLNKKCLEIKTEKDSQDKNGIREEFDLLGLLKSIKEESLTKLTSRVKKVVYQIDYTVILDSNVVPPGEVIRAWLPFPREVKERQEDIKLISTFPEKHLIADNENLQRSIYFEQDSKENQKMEFKISYQYTCYALYNNINPSKVQQYNTSSEEYRKFTEERPPHIVFTKELQDISKKVVGNETNPYLKAKKIFEWVNGYAPWASSREYSTLENIPKYLLENKHGDCGMQTLTFMTLARMNGIPTKWQSGWEADAKPIPVHDWSRTYNEPDGKYSWFSNSWRTTMHDWCMMYIEPYGWVPVDQSYGIKKSGDEDLKWFYLGNIDNRRLVINDEFSVPLYPSKVYPRSETVDFQRGELEWRGGNIYFDKWDYKYRVNEVK